MTEIVLTNPWISAKIYSKHKMAKCRTMEEQSIKMNLCIKRYEELNIDELYGILKARAEVFVVEQNCPYLDLDERDKKAFHVFLTEGDEIISYLRVLEKGVLFDEVTIGRVLTKRRRCGLGTQILKEGIKVAKERLEAKVIIVEAQTYARGLYEKQGFRQVSEEFLEDGIPHIKMRLDIE